MQVVRSIDVSYEFTNDAKVAKRWLDALPEIFASDFETAVRYSDETVADAKLKMVDMTLSRKERIEYQAIANASALGHPYHCTITHCSMAASENHGFVFIIDNQDIADVVLEFLVETDRTQIWHNYAYDGRFIKYYAGKQPKHIEDTQILAKTVVNHVEVFKAATGLKDLAGPWYGDWGISSENFTIAQQNDPKVIKYAATDACATFKLWGYINDIIKKENINQ